MKNEYFDLVVVIPLEEELLEFVDVFPSIEDRSSSTEFRHVVESGARDLRVLVVQQEQMGKGCASKTTAKVFEDYDVGLVTCLGIAGGLSSDLRLGDVCYSGTVIDVYDNAKVSDRPGGGTETELSPDIYHTPIDFTSAFNFIRTQPSLRPRYIAWQRERGATAKRMIAEPLKGRSGLDELPGEPSTKNGSIACGSVSKSDAYNKSLRAIDRRVLAIETEAGGIFARASEHDTPAMSIRGICDYADKGKGELEAGSKGSIRKLAASNAASFLKLQFENPCFLAALASRRQQRRGRQEELALLEKQPPPNLVSNALGVLHQEIQDALRKLSPEYRLQPKGYRLPIPRIKLSERGDELTITQAQPIELLDGVQKHDKLLLRIPRTYPDQGLSWVLAEELLTGELDGLQVVPVVIDGSTVRRKGIAAETKVDIEKLSSQPGVRLIFIVDNLPLSSTTKLDALMKELESYPDAKSLFIAKGDTNLVAETEFERKTGSLRFDVCAISFLEISSFIKKNFSMSGSEAEVVALRLRDTFDKFDLDAHPTYFAGISKEVLTALLQANRRSELIQLAVDGFLTFLVAGDREDITLSRSTRARFLRQLVVAMKVEKRNFSEELLIGYTQEFARRHDFDIKPIAFIQAFVDQGILHFADDRVHFSLPFIQSYLLAAELATDARNAEKYFRLEDTSFDLATFDLYAEIGASRELTEKVHTSLLESVDELPARAEETPILLTDQIAPSNMRNLGRAEAIRKRLQKATEDVNSGNDRSSEKQGFLDLSEKIRAATGKQREELRTALEQIASNEDESPLKKATRKWAIATVLLGSGAEHLDAQTKRRFSASLVTVAARIIDEWTRVQQTVDFDELKRGLTTEEALSAFASDLELDEKRRIASGFIDLMEHAAVADPLRRVVGYLCEQARHRVLATSVEKAEVHGTIEKVIHGTWLTDIDSDRGRHFLNEAIKELPAAPFLRVTLASHCISRVYWNHWQIRDRLCLLDAAESMIRTLKLSFDKPKLKRVIERDQKRTEQKGTKRKRKRR
jgi:nucleoside phosphorylase